MKGKIYFITHLKPPHTVKKLLYQAYLLPILKYCDVVFEPMNTHQTRPLERFHSKYISFCIDVSISSHSLIERCKFHAVLQTYKILYKLAPTYLHDIFEYVVNVTGCTTVYTEMPNHLLVPKVWTNYGKCSLYYCSDMLWNTLPAVLYGKTTLLWINSEAAI